MALSETLASLVGPASVPYVSVFSYDGDGALEYEGWAKCGSATSAATWGIKKYTYTAGALVSIQFANGGVQQNNIWDNRVSLSYS